MDLNRIKELAGIVTEGADEHMTTVQRTVIGHVDKEKHMVRKQLMNIKKYAEKLEEKLEELPDDADFPGWWQNKVAMANKCLSRAKHYLCGEEDVAADDDDDEVEIEFDSDM